MIATTEPAGLAPRLEEPDRRTLYAVVRRVLPSDDGFGAAEAGCPEYVTGVVEARLGAASLKKVRRGLRFVDDLAVQMCGRRFAEASGEDQDRALRQLQLTPHPTLQDFVHRVVNLTLEGFLGHPRHGGNRNEIGWRCLGIGCDGEPRRGDGGCTTS